MALPGLPEFTVSVEMEMNWVAPSVPLVKFEPSVPDSASKTTMPAAVEVRAAPSQATSDAMKMNEAADLEIKSIAESRVISPGEFILSEFIMVR